jgi:aspartate/methionine/tyrosine aminotransferase
MPAAARQRLLEIAVRHRLPIIEDGFDGALYYGERPPSPLKASDASGQIVYIGTFSKILFPGLRLGWVVAAPELIERLEMAKQLADIHTSPLIQAAVYTLPPALRSSTRCAFAASTSGAATRCSPRSGSTCPPASRGRSRRAASRCW